MTSTSTPVPAKRRSGQFDGLLALLARNAHWAVGFVALLFVVGWLETGIGGSWSADSRQNLYLIAIMLLYMMVAIGLNLVCGYAGAASIGHIAFFALGAYTEAILTTDYGWNIWPAVLVGGVLALLASLPAGLILLRLSGWYFSIVTLLLVLVVSDLILQLDGLTGGGAGIFGMTMPFIGSHQLDLHDYVYLLVALNVVLFLAFRHLVIRSRWGMAFIAVRDVEPAARAAGVHPFVVQESTLAISAFVAGIAGALFAPLPGFINGESFPILDSIFFLLVILTGGMGTVMGPVVGTLVLYVVPQTIARIEELKQWTFLVYGVILLGLVTFLPEGIVGGARRIQRHAVQRFPFLVPPGAGRRRPLTPEEATTAALGYLADRRRAGTGDTLALETQGIVRRFAGVAALDDVAIQVRPGTVHAIIGPNGSGKTTLLNVISGFYPQEAGTVWAGGSKLPRGRASGSIRRGIARTFQTPQMIASRTALQNVMLGSHTEGRSTIVEGLVPLPNVLRERTRAEERARACIALTGLSHIEDALVSTLPFAHRRLLEIARAVAGRPGILLLDEPASGLHPEEVRQFAALIRLFRDHGLTVVLVEHNFALVAELADEVTVLDAGKVLAVGDVASVRSNPAVVEAYLGV